MIQTGAIDETRILENKRACARHEISVVTRALDVIPGLRRDEIRRRVVEHLQRVECGFFDGVLTPDEIKAEIAKAHRLKPQTATVGAAQSGPVEVVGKPETATAGGALTPGRIYGGRADPSGMGGWGHSPRKRTLSADRIGQVGEDVLRARTGAFGCGWRGFPWPSGSQTPAGSVLSE